MMTTGSGNAGLVIVLSVAWCWGSYKIHQGKMGEWLRCVGTRFGVWELDEGFKEGKRIAEGKCSRMCQGRLHFGEETGREVVGRQDVSDTELRKSNLPNFRAGECHGIPSSFSKRLLRVVHKESS